ncbi:aminoglycoside phosphotransferase family protein [Pandoraea sp.]|uniref:aminoglycoside phosphotransferase family protein n=1 Tax=Pandoraea sp. TaxID=1883445 RepID=UPI0035AE4B32
MFEPYLQRWNLTRDGDAFASLSGHLLPVRFRDTPAILKLSHQPEEIAGADVMSWWAGDGAAPVLAHDGEALLMVRAQGSASLARMAREGRDDDATRILCATAARLHRPRAAPTPPLTSLTQWFSALSTLSSTQPPILAHSARAARELLGAPQERVVLHGDLHHGNVLDFGEMDWLAIDPKGLHGERGFDYANLFCNPDGETALAPGIFARRVDVVTQAADIDRERLLKWVLAWAGLSSVWCTEDGGDARRTLDVACLAAAALGIVE